MAQQERTPMTIGGQALDRDIENEPNLFVYNRNQSIPISQQKQALPIFAFKKDILFALETHRTVILLGETGSGKTTQLPQYLYQAGWADGGRCIACTQPRRLACISIATRVSREMHVNLGEEVGYGVRFDTYYDPERTRIKYMTEGHLVRETMVDPLLSRYSVILIDEAHERTLYTDILLGLVKKVMKKRTDLRLIVTSATIDVMEFKNFFETNTTKDPSLDTAIVIGIQGRQHTVDVYYSIDSVPDYIQGTIQTIYKLHIYEAQGDILAFLPGQDEVDRVCRGLEELAGNVVPGKRQMLILPLFGNLPFNQQKLIFDPTPFTHRKARIIPISKIVVATNVAETSITIDGVVYIVDSMFAKIPYFDSNTGLDSLVVQPISKASAKQRAGRAGRVGPGKCYRLCTEKDFKALEKKTIPEMQRSVLNWAVLQLKSLGIEDVLHFDFLSPPPAEALIRSLETIYSLKGLNDDCSLTYLGKQMAEFPLEPKLSAILIASLDYGCTEEALTVCSFISVQNIFREQPKNPDMVYYWKHAIHTLASNRGDTLTYINIYREFVKSNGSAEWCKENYVDTRVLRRTLEIRNQLKKYLQIISGNREFKSCEDDLDIIRKCLCVGLFSNVARLASDGSYITIKDHRKAFIHPSSMLLRISQVPDWIMYYDVQLTSEELMRDITVINPLWLLEIAPHYYESQDPRFAGGQAPIEEGDQSEALPVDPSQQFGPHLPSGDAEKRKAEHVDLFDEHMRKVFKF